MALFDVLYDGLKMNHIRNVQQLSPLLFHFHIFSSEYKQRMYSDGAITNCNFIKKNTARITNWSGVVYFEPFSAQNLVDQAEAILNNTSI